MSTSLAKLTKSQTQTNPKVCLSEPLSTQCVDVLVDTPSRSGPKGQNHSGASARTTPSALLFPMQLSKSKAVQTTRQPPERKPQKRETRPINQTGQLPPTSLRRVWLKQQVNPAADVRLIGPSQPQCQRPVTTSAHPTNHACGRNRFNDL